jgi:outer membrane protein OmpA-like peptidoglycan-associated protein
MKKNSFLLIALCLCCTFVGKAQDRPWFIGFHASAMDFVAPYSKDVSVFSSEAWNTGFGLSAGKQVSSSLVLMATGNTNRINRTKDRSNLDFNALYIDLALQYKFANGYILKEDSWFDPYLFVGIGNHILFNDIHYLNVNGGLGFNFWFNEVLGAYVQSSYNYINPQNYFHHQLGLRFRIKGAPDRDNDGVPDKDDKCPDEPGKKELQGCPDSDGDGVADADDKCPNQAGLKEFGGCPDTDGDGIPDNEDKCPNQAGLAQFGGCPDTDGDGIPDNEDACPNEAGSAATKGCPDRDGDGVADKEDKCPDQAGLAQFGGCPDTDGDGIPDNEDKCPTVKGTKANQGCPEDEPSQEVEDELNVAAKSIQFESGKAIIKKESFGDLDKIVEILKNYPKAKFRVEGHTDNVGNANNNKKLSQDRAAAVVKYLRDKGADGSRLRATGFGSEKPIADNKSPEGRAQNRRVEIHLDK